MVEQRRGVIPPQPRRPERQRPPRSAIMRRRLVALCILLAALIGLGFAIAGVRDRGAKTTPTVAAPPKPFRIIFPEGFTRADMAARVKSVAEIAERERGRTPRLSEKTYLAASAGDRFVSGFGRHPLEGFLFPATYQFTARTTAAQLIAAQLRAFRRNWRTIDLAYARSKNLTPYDVLIIASMVEKEAVAPDERPKIARVIYNRLHARMALGIDATVRYGFHVPGTESLRESQLNDASNPYNTRKRVGLTPTPIANPGLASLQAAAHPVAGDWLYFVRKPDRVHHFFTDSEQAFINYKNAHGFR